MNPRPVDRRAVRPLPTQPIPARSALSTATKLATLVLLLGCSPGAPPTPSPDPLGRNVGSLLFTDAQVLDSSGNGFRTVAQVHVVDGRIVALNESTADPALDSSTVDLVIDARDQFLIPGMVDMHVHHTSTGAFPEPEKEPLYDEADLLLYLAHGITTVRNLAGMAADPALARAVREGRLAGPRFVASGPPLLTGRSEHPVDTVERAEAEVRRQHAAGYDLIKLYCCFRPDNAEVLRAIFDTAEELGVPVVGHVAKDLPLQASSRLATIEHLEHLADLLDDDALALLRQAGTFVTPTLVPFEDPGLDSSEGRAAFVSSEPARYISGPFFEAELSSLESGDHFLSDAATRADLHALFERSLEATGRLHRAGVALLVGTDSGAIVHVVPGFSYARELELMVRAGVPAVDVLRAATWNAALALGEGDRRGRIAPGFDADLVLLDADPLHDIGAVRQIAGVLRGTRWFDRASLDEALRHLRRR